MACHYVLCFQTQTKTSSLFVMPMTEYIPPLRKPHCDYIKAIYCSLKQL